MGPTVASVVILAANLAAVSAAVPFTSVNTIFGTAIKNGPIPPTTELTVFQHNCTNAPCTVTQIHVPSIYPGPGCNFDWENGRLRIYVDGEGAPSIDVTLLELAFVSPRADAGSDAAKDVSPFSAELFGKNARTGGVFSTMRIPFGSTLRVTLTAPPSCTSPSIYWFIIRGIEALPVVVGDLQLPPQARLRLARNANVTVEPLDFLTLASAPATDDGLLLATYVDALSATPTFLEGCFRLGGPNYNASANDHAVYLSSGTEDYFLSASYFDEGPYASTQAGLTYRNGGQMSGDLSAYKLHTRDLVPFHGGFTLAWRNDETADCPTGWPSFPGSLTQPAANTAPDAAASKPVARALKARLGRNADGTGNDAAAAAAASARRLQAAPLQTTTLVYYYAWPSSATPAP